MNARGVTIRKLQDKITELNGNIKAKVSNFENLARNWTQEKSNVFDLKNELGLLEKINSSLQKKFESSNGRLLELEGFAEHLCEEKEETS